MASPERQTKIFTLVLVKPTFWRILNSLIVGAISVTICNDSGILFSP